MVEDEGARHAGPEAELEPARPGVARFALSYSEARRQKSRLRSRWSNIVEELDDELLPQVQPSFRLKAGDSVFTIGSCFARNIEANLAALGCEVPMLGLRLPPEEYDGTPTSVMNKFHPPAFRQSLEWTARIFDRDGVVTWEDCEALAFDLGDGRFQDLDMAPAVTPVPRARFLARRQQIYDVFRAAFSADCLMMTPGLIEAWRDLDTGLYTFGAPWGREVLARPERWRFEVLPYQQCLDDLLAAIDIVRARNPQVKALVTTSPVPLARTFSGRDIALANTHSKAVLRAVCESVLLEREGVDYFPSYEMAMLSNPARVWRSDRVHVSAGFVARIVGHMLDHYVEGVEAAAASYQRARGLFLARAYGEAESAAQEALAARPDHLEARLVLGMILAQQRRWAPAEAELRAVLAADPERSDARVQLACVLAFDGRASEAVQLLEDALGRDSVALGDVLSSAAVLERAPVDDAVRLGERAVQMFPLHVRVHELLTKALVRAGRTAEATRALRRAADLSHPPAALLLQLARLLLQAGERDQALAQVDKALSEEPANKEAISLRSELAADPAQA